MLVIISEHLLHPLQLCITHWPKTGKLCPYYGSVSAWVDFNVISGFVEEMLPKIVKALHTFPNIHFIFLAAAYRMYPHNSTESGNLRFEPIGVSMMDEYRVVLQKCHENVRKWLKIAKNWPKSTFIGQKWPKMTSFDPKYDISGKPPFTIASCPTLS